MPRYLLIRNPVGNTSKQLLAEVEAGNVLEAACKIGWKLEDVKFRVMIDGRYRDVNMKDWCPAHHHDEVGRLVNDVRDVRYAKGGENDNGKEGNNL